MKKNNKTKITVLVILILALVAAIGFFINRGKDGDKNINPENALIIVNDNYVLEEEYRLYFEEGKRFFESEAGSDIWDVTIDGQAADEVLKEHITDTIVKAKIERTKAIDYGLVLTNEDNNIINAQKNSGNEIIRTFYEDRIYSEKLREYVTKDFKVNEEDFENYLDLETLNKSDLTDIERDVYLESYIKEQHDRIYTSAFNGWKKSAVVEINSEKINKIK